MNRRSFLKQSGALGLYFGFPQAEEGELSLVLRGGSVLDGLGAPRQRADLGIRGARIVAIGDLSSSRAGSTCPG